MPSTAKFYDNISRYLTPVAFAFPGGAILPQTDWVLRDLHKSLPEKIMINGRWMSSVIFTALRNFLREQGQLQCIDERVIRSHAGQIHEGCAAADFIAQGLELGISGSMLTEMVGKSGMPWNPLLGDRHHHRAHGVIVNWLDASDSRSWGLTETVVEENLPRYEAPLILSCPTLPLFHYLEKQKNLGVSEQDQVVKALYDITMGITHTVIEGGHNLYPKGKPVHIVDVNKPANPGVREAAVIQYAEKVLTAGMVRNIRWYQAK